MRRRPGGRARHASASGRSCGHTPGGRREPKRVLRVAAVRHAPARQANAHTPNSPSSRSALESSQAVWAASQAHLSGQIQLGLWRTVTPGRHGSGLAVAATCAPGGGWRGCVCVSRGRHWRSHCSGGRGEAPGARGGSPPRGAAWSPRRRRAVRAGQRTHLPVPGVPRLAGAERGLDQGEDVSGQQRAGGGVQQADVARGVTRRVEPAQVAKAKGGQVAVRRRGVQQPQAGGGHLKGGGWGGGRAAQAALREESTRASCCSATSSPPGCCCQRLNLRLGGPAPAAAPTCAGCSPSRPTQRSVRE